MYSFLQQQLLYMS